MAQKPSIPKGTRDFLPEVMVRRNYIFDTIKNVFKRYGFLPIETPSMENTSAAGPPKPKARCRATRTSK